MKENFFPAAAELFKSYPDAQEFHFTADEMPFQRETDAVSHGRSLGQKPEDIVTVTREEAEAWAATPIKRNSDEKALAKAQQLEVKALESLKNAQAEFDQATDKTVKAAAGKALKVAQSTADAATAAVKLLADK